MLNDTSYMAVKYSSMYLYIPASYPCPLMKQSLDVPGLQRLQHSPSGFSCIFKGHLGLSHEHATIPSSLQKHAVHVVVSARGSTGWPDYNSTLI